MRADIDYGFREARTTYGRIGVKVWIYKGDILPYRTSGDDKATREAPWPWARRRAHPVPARWCPPAAVDADPKAPRRPRRRHRRQEAEPIIKEADPELERLLAEEEEIERLTREHHETPHFRPGEGD